MNEVSLLVNPHENHEVKFVAPHAGVLEGVDIFTGTSNVVRVALNDVTIDVQPEEGYVIEKGDCVIVYLFNDSTEEDSIEVTFRYHEVHPTEVPQGHAPLTAEEILGIIESHPERDRILELVTERAFATGGPDLSRL